ncbi:hypothetical protein RD1_2134 [Roseobacter denitrificans OCh 114]|uniref:Uncharacterized protein n=1 Tax=Roseobacter denitrificans (strain ATCC 33942 / OCh 114) TaxID=375451 RepID=Q167W3_ROSDO|nr:hypothetical protein RD1_2134 [Roseobacter denitrificans OCh 114]
MNCKNCVGNSQHEVFILCTEYDCKDEDYNGQDGAHTFTLPTMRNMIPRSVQDQDGK